MMRHPLPFLLLLVALGAASRASAQPANLLVNGDAEASNADPIPGWTSSQGATIAQYDHPGFPEATSPGPVARGQNFFTGGGEFGYVQSELVQTIDVSSMGVEFDGGTTPFTLCAYLGGYLSQGDDAIVTVRFESDAAVELGTASIGPVTPDERQGITGMALRTTTGTVPVGTRTMVVSMTFNRFEGTYNDGSADNLWLTLDEQCGEVFTTTTTSTSTTSTTTSTTSTSTTSTSTSTTSTSTTSTTSTTTTSSTSTRVTTSSTTPTTAPDTPPTTTTLPADPCDTVVDGPTFPSVECRLAALAMRVGAADELGTLHAKLTGNLTTAGERLRAAAAQCGAGNRKTSRASLKQVVSILARFTQRLSGHGASRHLDGTVRRGFVGTARDIAGDARRLRSTVACPADAATVDS